MKREFKEARELPVFDISREELCNILERVLALLPDSEEAPSVRITISQDKEELDLLGIDEIRLAPLTSDIGNCFIAVHKGAFAVYISVRFSFFLDSSQDVSCKGPVQHICSDVVNLIYSEFSRLRSDFSWMNPLRRLRVIIFAAPVGLSPTFINNIEYSIFMKIGLLGTILSGILWLHLLFGAIYTPRPIIYRSTKHVEKIHFLPYLSLLVAIISMAVSIYNVFFK